MTKKTKENLQVVAVIIALLLIMIFADSCRTGYGCSGRSKYITGHKPNGY